MDKLNEITNIKYILMLPLHHSLHDKIPFAIRQHKVITLRGFKNNEINTTDPIYTLKGIKENIKSEAFFFEEFG